MDTQVLCVIMLEYFWILFILLINQNLHSIESIKHSYAKASKRPALMCDLLCMVDLSFTQRAIHRDALPSPYPLI